MTEEEVLSGEGDSRTIYNSSREQTEKKRCWWGIITSGETKRVN